MSNLMQRESSSKSRNLSINQLFEILQEEYIVCELRAKIYPQSLITKDNKEVSPKSFWLQMMDKKRDKINDIARRHSSPSIFDDKYVMELVKKRVIPEIGFPKFIYKDEYQKLLQEKWDRHNYYSVKSEVKVYCEGTALVGTIELVNFAQEKIKVNINNSIKEFDINTVTRIL